MTTAQVVEMSVTVNNNSPIQDYIHLDDHTQSTYEMIPEFKPLTNSPLLFTLCLEFPFTSSCIATPSLLIIRLHFPLCLPFSGAASLLQIFTSLNAEPEIQAVDMHSVVVFGR